MNSTLYFIHHRTFGHWYDVLMSLADFSSFEFVSEGKSWKVYRRGSGPGVLIMSELPGITPQVVQFAERVVSAGFTVWLPHLFGEDGRSISQLYLARSVLEVCVRSEFAALAAHRASPITSILRAMGRELNVQTGGRGIGAIGMCVTGNFALAMMADEALLAPVLSQPALPFGTLTRDRKAAIHASVDQIEICKRRVAEGAKIVALRFTNDKLVPKERFETLRSEFGSGCETIEIDSSPGNPFGNPPDAHSVLTTHLIDKPGHPTRVALDRVLAFFNERLHGAAAASAAPTKP